MTRKSLIDQWLDAELDRTWLLAEIRLRRMQAGGAAAAAPAFETLFAERRKQRSGPAEPHANELADALGKVRTRLAQLRSRAPIGALALRLGLRPIEVDVLVATLAPLVDPLLAELYQLLRGARRGIDLALIGDLLALDRRQRLELLQAIDADRPLVRWSLIGIGGPNDGSPPTRRPIQVAPDVVATLCGDSDLPPGLVAHATLRRARAGVDDLLLPDELRAAHARIAPAERHPWFVLWGPDGAGRRELACRIAAACQRIALVFEPRTCPRDELATRLHHAQREALVRGAALVIGPVDDESETLATVVTGLRRYPDLVCFAITATTPPVLATEHPVHEIALRPLSRAHAFAMWQRHVELDVTPLVDGFELTPGDIVAAVGHARAVATTHGRAIEASDLRRGVELRLRAQLGDVVQRVAATERWADVVLPDADVERLREFIGRKRYASVVYGDWGLAKRIRYGKGMVALFSGEPGTGKTMLAGVIANELGLELYRVDLSQVVSKWAGESEKQLARIFDIAERTQAVLLFDEADSLFGKRGEIEGGRDRFANLTVNYLLQRLEQYPGVAVLTTNKEASLDDALQRRLSLHLRLEVPEVPERERLWRSFLVPELPGAAGIDVKWLARRYELAGGSIKNAAVRAAFLAAADGQPIDLPVVIAAVERELDDMGRVVWQLPAAQPQVALGVSVDDVILD